MRQDPGVSVIAVVPVKRFELAKQRLEPHLDKRARTALARAMLGDVLDALDGTRSIDAVVLVSAEPAAALDRRPGGRFVLVADNEEHGQSKAATIGLARAAELDADLAVLLPGDCPALDPAEVDELVQAAGNDDLTIVPDRHGEGTNALAFGPRDAFSPEFGPGSLARHLAQAKRRGLRYSVLELPSLGLDVDTLSDLAEVASLLRRETARAKLTAAVLREIEQANRLPIWA
jgi:2-phospho-L-lactate guanylyltransferase